MTEKMTEKMTEIMTLEDALRPFGGNKSALARALNITKQAITNWNSKKIPEKQAFILKYKVLPKLKKKLKSGRQGSRHDL